MTGAGRAANAWLDPAFVQAWAREDALGDLLDVPQRIAVAITAAADTEPRRVVDVGSGPGSFLAVFLRAHPRATGVWIDLSEEMERLARDRLASLGDRVAFVRADMTNLASIDLGGPASVVLTARASHHLAAPELERFYGWALEALAPGGWLFNLDHVRLEPEWDRRFRAARTILVGERRRTTEHHHNRPMPTLAEHLEALRSAGAGDAEIPWRAFFTVLLAARKR